MPQGNGLGFISTNVQDLFREIKGNFALQDPFELKPQYRIKRLHAKEPPPIHKPIDFQRYEIVQNVLETNPIGVLVIKVRLQDERFAIADVVRRPFMKWAIAESLAHAIYEVSGVQISGKEDILFCMDEVKILDVQIPHSGAQVWQFCEFRFDYMLQVDQQAGENAATAVFHEMAAFERIFCKALESRYRDIYHLTVLNLVGKQYALMSGQKHADGKALFQAAQQNDVATIKRLVSSANVNWRPKECAYPIEILEEA
jgi:hypothetical protein